MSPTHFSTDISEFIRLLAIHRVRYVIVGGEAVIYHGYARLTGDVDFFFDPAVENVKKLFLTLLEFWNGAIPGIKQPVELEKPGIIIQFGVPPNRIDLMNSISAVSFSEAWADKLMERISVKDEKFPIYFIGLNQLIKNKKAAARYKDLDDLKYLEKKGSYA